MGSGFSSYPSIVYPTPWGNKWIGNGQYKVQYGKVHRGYLRQYGSFTPSVGSFPETPWYSSKSSCQPVFLNTEQICVLPINVWIDYSTDLAKSVLSRFGDITPSTGVMTPNDQYLIYSNNSAGYVRLAKKAIDGKYNRVGTSQAGGSGRNVFQNNFITADGNHAVLSDYHGLVIVSINTVNETITQEVYDSSYQIVVYEYNGKIYTLSAGNYKIYELVSGVFTLTYSGTYANTMSLYGGGLVGEGLCLISDSNIANAKFIKLLPNGIEYYAPQSPLSHSITSVNNIITDGSPVFYCGVDRSAYTFYVDDSEVFVVMDTPPTDTDSAFAFRVSPTA